MTKENRDIALIWNRFIEGDREAFAYFYKLYVDHLYRYGTKLTSDADLVKDSIQEVFLDLFLKRSTNKSNPDNLKFYLILSLKRNIVKKLKFKRKYFNGELPDEHCFEPEYSIEQLVIEKESTVELNQKVLKAINELTSKQKEVIYLKYNEALDYSEISQVLNIAVESARKQVYRALKTVKESLGNRSVFLWHIFHFNRV